LTTTKDLSACKFERTLIQLLTVNNVLRVEVAELKSRPALLGACTSCPVLHREIDEMRAYTISLEAKL
jgi:hypothetical protein